MGDPYWRYGASAGTGSVPRPSFPGYLSAEAPPMTAHLQWSSNDYLRKDMLPLHPGAYAIHDAAVIGVRPENGLGGLTAEASNISHPSPLQDPGLLSQRRDVAAGMGPAISDIITERPGSLSKVDGIPVAARESNILFVDGLPSDCLRREVGHLFRPFIGFKEIRVVHKGPRRSGDKATVLCFVEFIDAKCAFTAMEALQGYKFDDRKPDSPVLRIHFAHFPFRPPSDSDEKRYGGPR